MFLRRTLLQIVIFTVLLVLSCGGEDTSSPFWHEKSDAARQINVYLSEETGVSWSTGGPASTPGPLLLGGALKERDVTPLLKRQDLHAIMVGVLREGKALIPDIGEGMGENAFCIPSREMNRKRCLNYGREGTTEQ